jgi:hypothetical protein
VIPTTSLTPEGVPQPLKTSWLSLQGWAPSFVGKEEKWQQWRQQCPHTGGSKSGQWTVQRELGGGGGRGGRSDKVVTMLPRGMQAVDNMTRGGGGGGGARRAGSGRHDERGGRRTTRGKLAADNTMRKLSHRPGGYGNVVEDYWPRLGWSLMQAHPYLSWLSNIKALKLVKAVAGLEK